MNVEEGIICEIRGDKAKVKMGKSRVKEVKLDNADRYDEGDIVKVMMGIVVCKA